MATLSSLRHLILLDCISCPHLPPLGQLPHLRYLDIDGALAVVTIGLEFLGNGVTAFPKLEFLYFNNMPNLEEWSMGEEIEDEGGAASTVRDITLPFYVSLLPCLTTMHLIDCPKLLALPEQLKHATMLQTLYIEGAHSLRAVENLPSLTQWLQISKSDSILRVSNLPQLRMLVLIHLPALSCVQNLDALQFLYVEDLLMDCLPDWVSGLLHQRQHHLHDNDLEFQMMCNIHVLERCQLGHQDWPIIQQFPKTEGNSNRRKEEVRISTFSSHCCLWICHPSHSKAKILELFTLVITTAFYSESKKTHGDVHVYLSFFGSLLVLL
ncbi:uncharacterized protein [Typha angustifolia]|uniref:uncharacterized protein isoform X3 n=1 Tax=Typha angustifolia TaxID=59011 RepID=UPI003C2FEEEF